MTRSKSKALDDDMPTNDCPMDALGGSMEPCFDDDTGILTTEWVEDEEWNADDYNGGMTWGDWYTKYKNYVEPSEEREWHLWCWKNRNNRKCPEAAEYIEAWGKPQEGTSTRIKQRANKEIAAEARQEEARRIRANENPPPIAEAKR